MYVRVRDEFWGSVLYWLASTGTGAWLYGVALGLSVSAGFASALRDEDPRSVELDPLVGATLGVVGIPACFGALTAAHVLVKGLQPSAVLSRLPLPDSAIITGIWLVLALIPVTLYLGSRFLGANLVRR
jgi:hypothetical protein